MDSIVGEGAALWAQLTEDVVSIEEDSAGFRQAMEGADVRLNGNASAKHSRRVAGVKLAKLAVIGVIACIAILIAPPIHATPLSQPGPCTSQVSGFDGARNPSISGITGAKAQINNDNPNICDASFRGTSSAWSMLTDSSGCYYSQVGWAKDYPYTRSQFFYESTTTCGTSSPIYFGTPAYTDSHEYEDDYVGSYTFHYYLDGSQVGSTTEPSGNHWTPAGVQYLGEVHDLADQMPGGTSAYVYFQNYQWRQNGTWYGGNTSAYDTFKYGGLYFPGTTIGIYDTRDSS